MKASTTHQDWLASLDEQRLTTLLRNRPEALLPSPPRTCSDLAARLDLIASALQAIRTLPAPAVILLQALVVLGADQREGVRREQLLSLVAPEGDPPSPIAALAPVLDHLTDHGLAWADEERVHIPATVGRAWHAPLGLGRPIMDFLVAVDRDRIAAIAGRLGLDSSGHKRQLYKSIIDCLSDPARLTAILAKAPDRTRELLDEVAHHGPAFALDCDYFSALYAKPHQRPREFEMLEWAQARGLVWLIDYSGIFEIPREVGRSLRGPEYRAVIPTTRPAIETATIDPEGREHQATGQVVALLDQYTAMLATAAKTPIALLKAGGVGVRELKRLAGASGCTEPEIRLYLDLAARTMMLDETRNGSGLEPTVVFRRWRHQSPEERLGVLHAAWWRLPTAPLRDIGDGKRRTPLAQDSYGLSSRDVRRAILRLLTQLPAEAEPRGPETILAAAAWYCPMVAPEARDTEITAALTEARLLGLSAEVGLTSIGRALVAADPHEDPSTGKTPAPPESMIKATGQLLGRAHQQARFGADLTAVVTGPPSADLAQLLDSTADRESKDAASIWRFGRASVRRALDAGQTAQGLLAALAVVAQGELPQPLVYLIEDVGRRHGEMRVAAVACCVLCDQPALLAEAAAHRKLAALRPSLLAPTVLASERPVDETLEALRAAGYLPVPAQPDGTIELVASTPTPQGRAVPRGRAVRREDSPSQSRAARRRGSPSDPAEVAKRLLSAPR
ncbi:MAG: helicase-associated domain-containing protein [Micromonosporaceae bacterium]|nr:helicase-associated domain-containing protein [Micromonosporaceae bacterium]